MNTPALSLSGDGAVAVSDRDLFDGERPQVQLDFAGGELTIADFVYVKGGLQFANQVVDVDIDGNGTWDAGTDWNDAQLLSVSASDARFFAGINGDFAQPDLSGAQSAGFSVTNGSLAFAMIAPAAGANERFIATSASLGEFTFVGIDGVEAAASELELDANLALDNTGALAPGAALDWSTAIDLNADADSAAGAAFGNVLSLSGEALDANEAAVAVSGSLNLDIFGQRLAADLALAASADRLDLALENASLGFGDGVSNYFNLEADNTTLVVEIPAGQTALGPQLSGQLNGTVATDLPGVELSGQFGVAIDTRTPQMVENGAGIDFVVYRSDVDSGVAGGEDPFDDLVVTVSEDGTNFYRVPVSADPVPRIEGDEEHDTAAYRVGFDLADAVDINSDPVAIGAARFISLVAPLVGAGDDPNDGFDVDAIGILNSPAGASSDRFPVFGAPNDAGPELGHSPSNSDVRGLSLDGGSPGIRATGSNVSLDVLGQKLTGNLSFAQHLDPGETTVRFSNLRGTTLDFGDGQLVATIIGGADLAEILLNDGDGADFTVYAAGAPPSSFADLTVTVSDNGYDFSAPLGALSPVRVAGDEVQIPIADPDTVFDTLARSYDIAEASLEQIRFVKLEGPAGAGFLVDALGIVEGREAQADLLFPEFGVPDGIGYQVGNTASGNAGVVVVGASEDPPAEAEIVVGASGMIVDLQASVALNAGSASLEGDFSLQMVTTDPAASFVRVVGIGAELTVHDQTLSGNFSAEQATASSGESVVRIAVADIAMAFTSGENELLSIADGSGTVLLAGAEVAADLSAQATLNVPQLGLANSSVAVRLNTGEAPVDDSFSIGNRTTALSIPGGPYLRIEAIDTRVTLDVPGAQAGTAAELSGDFLFEQQTVGVAVQTFVALSNLSVTYDGQGLQGGEGAFLLNSSGVAGFISGTASVAEGPVSLGGTLGLRVNTTGAAIDPAVVLDLGGRQFSIAFAAAEVFEFFASDLALDIGGFVTVEGGLEFSANRLVLTDASLFLGQGPALLDDGSLNPSARGVLLEDAYGIALRFNDGDFLRVGGNVTLLGVPNATLTGSATITVFDSATATFSETGIDVGAPGSLESFDQDTYARDTFDFSGSLDLAAAGQSLLGDFAFSRTLTGDGVAAIAASIDAASFSLGGGASAALAASGVSGSAMFTADGVAASLQTSDLDIGSVPADPIFAADLIASIAFNGIPAAVDEVVGTTELKLVAGPYLRVEVDGTAGSGLSLFGQRLNGQFVFEETQNQLMLDLRDGSLAFDADGTQVLRVDAAAGELMLSSTGAEGSISGAANLVLAPADLSLRADVAVAFASAPAAGAAQISAQANNAQLEILGQRLSGDFGFEQTATEVELQGSNLALEFGTGSADILTASLSSGMLSLSDTSLTASLSGASVELSVPNLALAGDFDIAIDSAAGTVLATPSAAGGAAPTRLTIDGQSITGDISFARSERGGADGDVSTAADNETVVFLRLDNGMVDLSSAGFALDVASLNGEFLLTPDGVAASIGGTLAASVAGLFSVDTGGGSVRIDVNTIGGAIDDQFGGLAGLGAPITLDLEAGPYLRIAAENVTATVSVGADDSTLTGNFVFESQARDDGFGGQEQVLLAGLSDLTVQIAGIGDQTLSDGRGALLLSAAGVAGFVSGTAAGAGQGFSVGGSIGARFNNTGVALDESVIINGDSLQLLFSADETDFFEFFGAGLAFDVGGFVTIEGNVSFSNAGNGLEIFGATDALVFIGQGPLRLNADDSAFNPAARGLLIRDASVALVRVSATGGLALEVQGQVEALGLEGIEIDGLAQVRFNDTGVAIDRTITVPNASGESESLRLDFSQDADPRLDETQIRSFAVLGATLTIAGQQLEGRFAFDKTEVDGETLLSVVFADVSLAFGPRRQRDH